MYSDDNQDFFENKQPKVSSENNDQDYTNSHNEHIYEDTKRIINKALLDGALGCINFDSAARDNKTSSALVSAERMKYFRRDVYVSVYDKEQNIEFLGRIVEGPFHMPHEVSLDSAITRTTVLHPDRTNFRPSYFVHGVIEVLGQLADSKRLVPSLTRPRPYSEISIFPPDRLSGFLNIEGNMFFGHLTGYDKERIPVKADSENKNFLPRNVGIFGTVGSGKSNTTQVLIEEAIQAGWAVVVIDVEGEYVRMNQANDREDMKQILSEQFSLTSKGISNFQVYVPSSGESDAENSKHFKVPISQLDPSIIGDILEFSEPQYRMFETLVSYVKQNKDNQKQGNLGALVENRNLMPTEVTYTLQDLIDVLGYDEKRLKDNLKLKSNEITSAFTLRKKLINFGRSGMLDWNQNKGIGYINANDLLISERLSVLDVSETDDRSRNIAIAYILQTLFDAVITTPINEVLPGTRNRKRPKVLVVIEEVHTFVSRQSASKMRAVLDNLQMISRRGRKRWMSLALVSQQPGHVPDELFELANTRFIHQLKSTSNLAPVKQTTGGVHEALWTSVPALGPGQCLLTGSVFKNPIFVNLRPAASKRLHTD